jgi:hypothetical protein
MGRRAIPDSGIFACWHADELIFEGMKFLPSSLGGPKFQLTFKDFVMVKKRRD